ADHSLSVSRSTDISATFSKHVGNVTTATFLVSGPTGQIAGTIFYDNVTDTAHFTSELLLPAGQAIPVQLTSGIESSSHIPLMCPNTCPYGWQFATLDDEPPTVVTSSPLDTQTMVPVGTPILITFSEQVMNVTIGTTFTVGPSIAGTLSTG